MSKQSKTTKIWLWIAGFVLINFLTAETFIRWDITEEQRYSLAEVSVNTLSELNGPVEMDVYIEGEFPAEIRKFQQILRNRLIEMEQYSNYPLRTIYIDPSKNAELRGELMRKRVVPIRVNIRESATDVSQKQLFPVISIRAGDREQLVDVLKGSVLPNGEINFEKAEADLEYKIISAIRNLNKDRGSLVAWILGHGEMKLEDIPADLGNEIQNSYELGVYDMRANAGQVISPEISALIIAGPQSAFSERDKYELDQYLMRGGNIIWLLDMQEVDMDIYQKQSTLTLLRELNLDDFFLKHGIKINYDLLQDLECEKIEVFQEGPSGGKYDALPWLFYPMHYSFPEHPISRNIDAVLLRYAGTIDTFSVSGLTKEVFMASSPRSRILNGRQFVDLNNYLTNPPPSQEFTQNSLITGLLVNGSYNSLFQGRSTSPVLMDSLVKGPPSEPFLDKSLSGSQGSMVIISDSDFLRQNSFRGKPTPFLPYDNKALIMNAMDFVTGDEALTQIRSKEIVTRRLDKDKIRENTTLIRIVNIALPLLLILIFAILRHWLRARQYRRIQY